MSGSDTDSGCLSVNNVLGFPNESTIVHVRGPHMDGTLNLNLGTNSLVVPRNMEQQHLADLSVQPHNFQSSFRGFAQSSMISGRGRAPSPTMSMCSNMSTSDSIVAALKSGRFNKHELRSMSEAFSKLMKGRVRKRIARRRNRKLFLKGARRQTGYDSGELGSDSSISSDDCLSTRTGITAMNRCSRTIYRNSRGGRSSDDARSIQSDVNELRRTIKDKTMFRDCTDHLKKDSFKNIYSLGPRKNASMNRMQNKNNTVQNVLQKDRFKNSFLLPSQRFAQSNSVLPIPEEGNENLIFQVKKKPLMIPTINQRITYNNTAIDSDKEDSIFSEATDPENSILKHPETHRKRNLNNSDDSICSEKKKTKLSSDDSFCSEKKMTKHSNATEKIAVASSQATNNHVKETINDFVFAKPQTPIRKLSSMKQQDQIIKAVEKSKSSTVYKPLSPIKKPTQERTSPDECSESMQSSEVSMRPSFMKRKLFTQTLDFTENKGSADSSPSVSPAKGYSELPKEKNKARKLVTSQSYLSRDIPCDKNNHLDLINKIVACDRMHVTNNTTQRKEIRPQTTDTTVKNSDMDEKEWDITAVLSNCRDDDHSDTYTDEEIFVVCDKKESKKNTKKNTVQITQCNKSPPKEKPVAKTCTVVLEKINEAKGTKKTEDTKKTAYYAHAFWNCDSDSELEGQNTPKEKKLTNESSGNASQILKNFVDTRNNPNSTNTTIASITCLIKDDSTGRPRKPSNAGNATLSALQHASTSLQDESMSPNATKRGRGRPRKFPNTTCVTSLNIDEIESPHLDFTRRCRPRKFSNSVNPTASVLQHASTSLQDESMSSNASKRGRGRPRKLPNNTCVTSLNIDESESPHLDFTRRGRPRKYCNSANPTASALQHASTSLQPECMSSNAFNKDRSRPKKVSNNASNTTVQDSPTDIKKRKSAKALEKPKPLGTNRTMRSRILETPKKSNIELSSKLKASKKKVATEKNTAKLEQQKVDLSKEMKKAPQKTDKQAPQKTDKDNKRSQPKNAQKKTVLPKTTMNKTGQSKNATKESSKDNKKVLRKSILEDYFCRTTRSSRENSFLGKPASPPKIKAGKTRKREPMKLPQTKAATKLTDDSRTSDKENTSHNTTYQKRVRKNTSMFQCCGGETPKRDTSRHCPKPNVPVQKANVGTDRVEAPGWPSVSMMSFRSVRDKRKATASKWDLGIAKATIGVVPWHYVAEEPCKTIIDDDSKSVTVRSMASTSILSRSSRAKFLHVW